MLTITRVVDFLQNNKPVNMSHIEISNLNGMTKEWVGILYLNNILSYEDLTSTFASDLLEKMTKTKLLLHLSTPMPSLETIYTWIIFASHYNL